MKDIIISRRRQIHELKTLLVCFLLAFVLNAYAIIAYNGSWTELITSLFYVITFAIVLYIVWSCIRVIYFLLTRNKKKQKHT